MGVQEIGSQLKEFKYALISELFDSIESEFNMDIFPEWENFKKKELEKDLK